MNNDGFRITYNKCPTRRNLLDEDYQGVIIEPILNQKEDIVFAPSEYSY